MHKFRHYPIFINYNIFTEEERGQALMARTARFYGSAAGLKYVKEMEEARIKYGDAYDWEAESRKILVDREDKRRDEIQPEAWSHEGMRYEIEVLRALETILTVPIGKLLLSLMTPREKIWILKDQGGPGVASTTPGIMRKDLGGGVRVYYDPMGLRDYREDSYTPDDVLFHELVHAYRYARLDTKGANHTPLRDYESAEEFIATQMQNVYLSQRGKMKFYLSHNDTSLVTKEKAYNNIASDPKAMKALDDYLRSERLASIVATWTAPYFNPWRDRKTLGN